MYRIWIDNRNKQEDKEDQICKDFAKNEYTL